MLQVFEICADSTAIQLITSSACSVIVVGCGSTAGGRSCLTGGCRLVNFGWFVIAKTNQSMDLRDMYH